MKAKILFVDNSEIEYVGLIDYETTNFFLKLVDQTNREHNIALGFIREMIWETEDE